MNEIEINRLRLQQERDDIAVIVPVYMGAEVCGN